MCYKNPVKNLIFNIPIAYSFICQQSWIWTCQLRLLWWFGFFCLRPASRPGSPHPVRPANIMWGSHPLSWLTSHPHALASHNLMLTILSLEYRPPLALNISFGLVWPMCQQPIQVEVILWDYDAVVRLEIICDLIFHPNDHFISPRVCNPVVIHPSPYLTTMANFVPPPSPLLRIAPARAGILLEDCSPSTGGWTGRRVASILRLEAERLDRDRSAGRSRSRLWFGAEHSTGGGERERSVSWRSPLEEVGRSPDLSWYFWSPLISVILVISVVKGECLALSSSRLHLDKFLLVSFVTLDCQECPELWIGYPCSPWQHTQGCWFEMPMLVSMLMLLLRVMLIPMPMLMSMLIVMLMPELRVLCRLQLPIERRLLSEQEGRAANKTHLENLHLGIPEQKKLGKFGTCPEM